MNDDGQEARKMVKVQYLHREIVNVALGEVFAQNVKTACWHETIDNSGAMLQTKDRGKHHQKQALIPVQIWKTKIVIKLFTIKFNA